MKAEGPKPVAKPVPFPREMEPSIALLRKSHGGEAHDLISSNASGPGSKHFASDEQYQVARAEEMEEDSKLKVAGYYRKSKAM